MKVPADLLPNYPALTHGDRQCSHFKSICICGVRFKDLELTCSSCGRARERCKNVCMDHEDSCRVHARGRPLSIYTSLAGKLGDAELEQLVSEDDRSLEQEYGLAKIILSQALDNKRFLTASPMEQLEMVNKFFDIAQKRKRIEEGDMLNIKVDDRLVQSIRNKMREFVAALSVVLEKHIPQESLRQQILMDVREEAKTLGNQVTLGDFQKRLT